MANVLFKRGLSSVLLAEGFVVQDGTFYLTTDTNKIYWGNNGELKELSYQEFVDNDHDTDTAVTGLTFERDETVTDKVKFNVSLAQTVTDVLAGTEETLDPVEGTFEITQDDFNALVQGAEVGLKVEADQETGNVVLGTTGTGAGTAAVSFVGDEEYNGFVSLGEDGAVNFSSFKINSLELNDSNLVLQTQANGKDAVNYTVDLSDLLKDIDAMTYKGTVGDREGATVTDLPTEGVSIGDVYMAVANDLYFQDGNIVANANVGDLFIAIGTEENGVIVSNLSWTHVPSGNETFTDTNTTYAFERAITAEENKITITDTITDNDDQSEINPLTTSISSETLTLSKKSDSEYSVDLVWGSF